MLLRFASIQSRILFLHAVAVVITAICMPYVLYWFLKSDVESLQRNALQKQVEELALYLGPGPGGKLLLELPTGLRDQYSEAYGRYAYAVLGESGEVLFSSAKEGAPIFPVSARDGEIAFPEVRRGQRNVSGASMRKHLAGRSVIIQVSEDLGHRDVLLDDVVANFFHNVSWITLPILLLLLATDILIFRRAVRPLLRASGQAERISPLRTDIRLPVDDIPREARSLVVAVNQALDRLDEGFRRQRGFTADVAHELRTPLAIMRTRLDTLTDQQASRALIRTVDSMNRVVSQLLDAAELETLVVLPGEKADLRAICAEIAEFIAPLALAQEKTIALSGAGEPVWVRGNAEMLRRAVRNLVENALNHTPKGSTVEIVVGCERTISVLDQGEGIPIASRQKIFQRFWRRDRQRAGGAGLGLSIVKRILDAHGATIVAGNRPAGGADFSIRFPPVGAGAPPALGPVEPPSSAG